MSKSDLARVKSIWGNFGFDFVELLADGHSGGILSVWDPSVFFKLDTFLFDNCLIVSGKWINHDLDCYMVNIYAPQPENEKVELWDKISRFMEANRGNYILCGDFNSVRRPNERMGTNFSKVNAVNFNSFIERVELIDMPLGRHRYSRISTDGAKASRLDRFLVNHEILDKIHDLKLKALDDILPDHRPLLIFIQKLDFGPTPFKFFLIHGSTLRVLIMLLIKVGTIQSER